jgi:hypothetical protein
MAENQITDATNKTWPDWKMTQDPTDGSWEVGYHRDGRHILLAYGLTREAATIIAAAPAMRDALAQLIGWVEECDSNHEGREFCLTEARSALRKLHAVHS